MAGVGYTFFRIGDVPRVMVAKGVVFFLEFVAFEGEVVIARIVVRLNLMLTVSKDSFEGNLRSVSRSESA